MEILNLKKNNNNWKYMRIRCTSVLHYASVAWQICNVAATPAGAALLCVALHWLMVDATSRLHSLVFFHWTRFLDLLQQACYCCCYCCWYYLCCRNLFIAACLPIECGTAAMRALLLLLFLSFFCFCVCCTVFRFVVAGSVLLFALFPHNSIIYAWILSATLDFSTSSSNVQLSI